MLLISLEKWTACLFALSIFITNTFCYCVSTYWYNTYKCQNEFYLSNFISYKKLLNFSNLKLNS